jgi:hypothetical protein
MLAPIPLRLREYGTDLRAMIVFNSFMYPLLNAGDAAIFQATGWNGGGIYVYRVSGALHISHVRFDGKGYTFQNDVHDEQEKAEEKKGCLTGAIIFLLFGAAFALGGPFGVLLLVILLVVIYVGFLLITGIANLLTKRKKK